MNDPKKGGYTTPTPALDLTTSLQGDWYFTKGSVTGAPLPDPPPTLLRGAPKPPPPRKPIFPSPREGERTKWLHNPCRLGVPMLGKRWPEGLCEVALSPARRALQKGGGASLGCLNRVSHAHPFCRGQHPPPPGAATGAAMLQGWAAAAAFYSHPQKYIPKALQMTSTNKGATQNTWLWCEANESGGQFFNSQADLTAWLAM